MENIHNISFSYPFLPMKQLAKECGVSYKWLEAEVRAEKQKGIDEVVIEGVIYSTIPGRLKLSNRSYSWNPKIFYHYYYLPKTQSTFKVERPTQTRNGNQLFMVFKNNGQLIERKQI